MAKLTTINDSPGSDIELPRERLNTREEIQDKVYSAIRQANGCIL